MEKSLLLADGFATVNVENGFVGAAEVDAHAPGLEVVAGNASWAHKDRVFQIGWGVPTPTNAHCGVPRCHIMKDPRL